MSLVWKKGHVHEPYLNCIQALASVIGMPEELLLQEAMSLTGSSSDIPRSETGIKAWEEVAKHASDLTPHTLAGTSTLI